jgi:hypothetical protein
MEGMEYPPGGPIRPDIIRPTGVNPVGKMEQPLYFFSRSAGPSFFSKRNLDAAHISPGEMVWVNGMDERLGDKKGQ